MIHLEQTVFAIQSASEDLIELALSVAIPGNTEDRDKLDAEVHSTMLELMAAVILSRGRLCAGHQAFLQIILKRPNANMTDERIINDYGARWAQHHHRIPVFFQRAIDSDIRRRTRVAASMLCLIQLIGNNCAITDGDFNPSEQHLIRDYITRLHCHMESALL
ncbi:MAG: hypothetical protein WCH99_13995 [Verrucomicrobiota bacterium]